MSKELTTEQKIMQATQYGLLIYAGQRKIYDEDERLKLEKIANEIGEYWGLEEPVAGYPELFEEITLQGLCRYASEMQYTHGETERERIKEVLDLVYDRFVSLFALFLLILHGIRNTIGCKSETKNIPK